MLSFNGNVAATVIDKATNSTAAVDVPVKDWLLQIHCNGIIDSYCESQIVMKLPVIDFGTVREASLQATTFRSLCVEVFLKLKIMFVSMVDFRYPIRA